MDGSYSFQFDTYHAQKTSVVPTGSRRDKIVALARNGRTPTELAEEFEPTQTATSGWLKQANRDEEVHSTGPERRDQLASTETESAAAEAGHPRKKIGVPPGGLVPGGDRRRVSKIFRFMDPHQTELPITVMRECSGSIQERQLQVAEPTSLQAVSGGRNADHENQESAQTDRKAPMGPVRYTRRCRMEGTRVGKKRPHDLMKAADLKGADRRKSVSTTV